MRSSLINKIAVVFALMLVFWFFFRIVRLLLPMLLVAIVIGFLWDWASGGPKGDKFDDYEEL
jgi:hypothetical protein